MPKRTFQTSQVVFRQSCFEIGSSKRRMRRRWCDLCRGDAERGEELTKCSSCPRKFHPECIPGWRPGHKKAAGWQCATCEEEERQRAEEEDDTASASAVPAGSSAGGRKRGRNGSGGKSKAEAEAAQRKKVSTIFC